MAWKFFQISVALAVAFANIYWGVTDNWYLVALGSIVAVIMVMIFVNAFVGLWGALTWAFKLLAARFHKRVDDGKRPRVGRSSVGQ